MAGTNLGTAYVQIMPSAKGISKNIESELSGGGGIGKSAGSLIGGNLVKGILGVVAGAGIVSSIKNVLGAGGALQQSFGGLDTIYGDAAEAAKEYSKEAAKAGISMNAYAEQAVSFGASLKQAYGGDTAQAVEAANVAILDMADNAAKMGTPLQSIQNAYQGFAKQNYTMLDNLKLGYGGTKGEMERLLKDATKLSGVKYDLSNLGDVYSAIHVIQEDLGLTGVAAAEAEGTYTGSMQAMKAATENFMAALATGEDIMPSLRQLGGNMMVFVKNNLLPMLGNVLKAVPQALDGITEMLTDTLKEAAGSGDLVNGALDIVSAIGKSILVNGEKLIIPILQTLMSAAPRVLAAGMDMVKWLTDGVMQSVPGFLDAASGLITQLIDYIGSALPSLLEKGTEIVVSIAEGLFDAAPDLIAKAGEVVGDVLKAIVDNLPSFLASGRNMVSKIAEGIRSIGNNIPEILTSFATTAKNLVAQIDWIKLGKDVVDFIIDGVIELGAALGDALASVGSWAKDKLANIDWVQLGKDVINFILSGLQALFFDIPSKLWDIMENAKKWVSDNGGWMQVGQNIIHGIVEGIKSIGASIWESLKGFIGGAIQGAKDFLQIKSPSRVFRDEVGAMIPLGLAAGIEGEAGAVQTAMDDLARASVGDIDTDLSVSGRFAAPMASAPVNNVINVTLNATSETPEEFADRFVRRLQMEVRMA